MEGERLTIVELFNQRKNQGLLENFDYAQTCMKCTAIEVVPKRLREIINKELS